MRSGQRIIRTFDQIEIPNPEVLVADPSPHAVLDFDRWFAHEAADYIAFQAAHSPAIHKGSVDHHQLHDLA